MDWIVRDVDVFDDDVMRAHYAVVRAAHLMNREDAPFWSEREHVAEFRKDDPAESLTASAAYDPSDGTLVGAGMLMMFLLDNREKGFVEVYVDPDRQGHGVGSALASHLARSADAAGRTTLLAQAHYPFDRRDDHPYRKFLEKQGYQLAMTQVRRDLRLPVAPESIDGWITEAARHHQGYRIETYAGAPPDELLESFVFVVNQLVVDAPQGDEQWEPQAITPELFTAQQKHHADAGRETLHTVAVDESTGEVVAYSTLSVRLGDDDVNQWGTLVHRDHRGHRLGLAVKAHALADLQRRYPDSTRISTVNAEVNQQMVGINERLGFEPVEILGEFQRTLG